MLGELIQGLILWLVTKKLFIRVLRNLSFASQFYPCIVSSHIGSFANLAEYPPFKPTSSFVLTHWPTYQSLEYGDDTSQEGASKRRFKFPLIKTSGTYLNTTSSLLGDEQTSKHGGGVRYYANWSYRGDKKWIRGEEKKIQSTSHVKKKKRRKKGRKQEKRKRKK
jgi:hypothetical protein